MIPSYWYSLPVAIAWQVVLHSFVAAGILYAWSRRVGTTSGSSKRWMLGAILVLPLGTALVPGRYGFDFRDHEAWLDSLRVLALPVWGGVHLYHLAIAVSALAAGATVVQEILPSLRRHRPVAEAPAAVVAAARSLPGWAGCRVSETAEDEIAVHTGGRPHRPCVGVSRGTLARLTDEELAAVLRHENAHWQRGRWFWTHLLFALRLAQLWNPVALWTFREHSVETEIACDADAVGGGDPRPLVRALLKVYDATDRRDLAARGTLRKRVDVLLGRLEMVEGRPPLPAVWAGIALLALILPWLV